MKNSITNDNFTQMQYVPAGKRRFNHHFSFRKKDNIIKNIEIIVACIVAFIVGIGVYNVL
ncbi:MAG: hypothetical protein EOO45_04905 [Flavobacterium sp.]|nr:MAG: hypothetical protein EOO45_04905 [Flavobacterium sp.]